MNKLHPISLMFGLLCGLLYLTACQQSETPNKYIDSESVIVSYGTNEINLQELDNYIVNLPANQRWATHEQKK